MNDTPVTLPVVVVAPEWLNDRAVEAIFGITRTRSRNLRRAGLIRWKALPADGGNGERPRVLMSAQSIREWLATLPDGEPKAGKPETEKQIA